MARHEIIMPQMGESITNGTITKWHKRPGDKVQEDEILLEISTDKVESEIPSPHTGRLEEVLFPEGETIDIGITIAIVEDDLSVEFNGKTSSNVATTTKKIEAISEVKIPHSISPKKSDEKRFYTPLVKSLANKHAVALEELKSISGTGAGGRVSKKDFLAYLDSRQGKSTNALTGIDLAGSGKVEIIQMDNMRKAISQNMIASKHISAHVNSISEVDLTHLVKFREAFKEEFFKQEGFKLTYTPFLIKAITEALKDFPIINSSVDGDKIILKKDINVGCAVAIPGNGLTVPVIKNTDTYSMLGLCRVLNELANKARTKKLTIDNLKDGTFSFTNVGGFGTILATPIILQPQVAIYAAGMIQKRVVVVEDDAIAVRSMMYATATYDHRVIDGEVGGKFLEKIHQYLRLMKPNEMF